MTDHHFDASVFREYDIRGIAGRDLSVDFAETLGLACARFIRQNSKTNSEGEKLKVSVGRDCRLSSDQYGEAVIRGLVQGGVKVVRLGICPTPLTYFSLFHLNLAGGIMITASHNPPEYNGFKICLGRETIYGDQIQEIRTLMEELRSKGDPIGAIETEADLVSNYAIIPAYVDFQNAHFSKGMKKKIVMDSGNGTAGVVAPDLLRSLGAEVIELYSNMDGRFPNHIPDPTVEANLKDLIEAVKKNHADFGIGFDGDADRIGVVDEKGRKIPGDELMTLFSRNVLSSNPGAIVVSEVKSSFTLFDDIRKHGGKPIMWKAGHSLIKAKMRETQALLGGEISGHVCFSDRYYGFDDAIYAALRVLEIAHKDSRPFSELTADLPRTYATPEFRIPFDDALKFDLVADVRRAISEEAKSRNLEINDIDGVRADYGDGWALVRASNTQPLLSIRFEATSRERLAEIKSEFESLIAASCKRMGKAPLRFEEP
ncbi:MAG: phosphomannomutase [Bdellovibrionaceae bacterium]|nr:phosphomannomutase [Pseudobdellovibrionaceae bacterium]